MVYDFTVSPFGGPKRDFLTGCDILRATQQQQQQQQQQAAATPGLPDGDSGDKATPKQRDSGSVCFVE